MPVTGAKRVEGAEARTGVPSHGFTADGADATLVEVSVRGPRGLAAFPRQEAGFTLSERLSRHFGVFREAVQVTIE